AMNMDDGIGLVRQPPLVPFTGYTDAESAVRQLVEIYERNTAFIRENFAGYVKQGLPSKHRVRACYPAIRIRVDTWQEVDSRLSYGHVVEPGVYMTTVPQPRLFYNYLIEQIGLLLRNHGGPVELGESDMPIPLHFSFMGGEYVEGVYGEDPRGISLRDHFDVPNLAVTDDAIVNGTWQGRPGEPLPLAPFTAPRVDYSLHRLQHYTATAPEHFQSFVVFTNYQFYVDEFCQWARDVLKRGEGGYTALIEPGNVITPAGPEARSTGLQPVRTPPIDRVDYSLHRLQHYTATAPEHFQSFVVFTNYQFYVDEFCQWARDVLKRGEGGYTALIEPGNVITPAGPEARSTGLPPVRTPQMPSYHLVRGRTTGITLINIGVGPSNARTIADHVAVRRPSAWIMLGHCAGLRTTQRLGDYVLAHGYVREDHVLDADLPLWVPVPPLAEIQVALEEA